MHDKLSLNERKNAMQQHRIPALFEQAWNELGFVSEQSRANVHTHHTSSSCINEPKIRSSAPFHLVEQSTRRRTHAQIDVFGS